MKVLFYCHHSLGIGHYARTLKLAAALQPRHPVAILSGGVAPTGLPVASGVVVKQLPAITLLADGKLAPRDTGASLAQTFAERLSAIRDFAERYHADILIVEMFPFGRRKFATEIIELIETVRRNRRALVFCSVRDVLVSRAQKQARYDAQVVQWLNRYFDAVLTHGDARFISLAETFSRYASIHIPVHHTGYIAATPPGSKAKTTEPFAIVSCGGGRVGGRLLAAATGSAKALRRETGLETVILRPQSECTELDCADDECYRTRPFEPDLAALLSRSALSISQCGYNTATDVLAAGVPAVFVPFETATEDEQLYRARRFQAHGRASVLREADLDSDSLVRCALQALRQKQEAVASLRGAANSAALIEDYHANAS